MTTLDLAICGAQIVTEEGIWPADVGIAGETIALIAAPGALPPARHTIDAGGMLLLPGAIDVHFHCRTPGYDERGDFFSETQAAAAGGVTAVFEMPISKPGCATPAIFRNRRRLIEAQAVIDVALYGAPGTLIAEDVYGMAAEGAIAFKIFMHRAPLGRDDEFIGICLPDDDQLHQALKLVAATGRRLAVHCESDAMLEAGIAALRAAGRYDPAAHMESRPPVVEAVAVARLLTLAADAGARVHVAHVSCAQALDVVRHFRRAGLDVTAETCPHYLFFDERDFLRLGAYAKINPPIRTAADQQALWAGLADGTLDLVTTDHSTFLPHEKERGASDIWRAPAGAPGVQTLLPAMISAALQGRISLTTAVRLISGAPARIFGIADRKGAIRPGLDADLCLYDPRPITIFSRERMVSRARDVDRLYEGM
ncbi:MAG TPA: dihydroorotase family protein, partial [Roseiflexaceae bacterium]|nr:dihydroorotase family protein [Roseiflexaceae bacterium]